jgi:uracil-DNA glycosylase
MNEKEKHLLELYEQNKNCTRCKLCKTRNKLVFGSGNPCADIMFIGEGPGKDEDMKGLPFVGRAGELLTSIIEKGMLLKRDDVYIANVVKCRPTVNQEGTRDRPPEKEETEACGWMLLTQIDIISPKVIITLGNPSTRFLLKTDEGITRIRGNFAKYKDFDVMPTYHPSYILRNGGDNSPLKKDVWKDIKKVLKRLDMRLPGKK